MNEVVTLAEILRVEDVFGSDMNSQNRSQLQCSTLIEASTEFYVVGKYREIETSPNEAFFWCRGIPLPGRLRCIEMQVQQAVTRIYLDPAQPPTKRIPFRQIRGVPFVRNVSICMPSRVYDRLYSKERSHHGSSSGSSKLGHEVTYHKIISTLKDILSDYNLRTGNYIMLAQPYPSSGSTILSANSITMRLNCGRLIIEMPCEVYQRSGLTSPHHVSQVAGGGRKHDKRSARYKVEIDLRQTSMVKGKKSLDRLVRASEQVDGLREGRVWLVADLNKGEDKQGKKRKRGDKDDDQARADDGNTTSNTTTVPDTHTKPEPDDEKHPLLTYHPTTITGPGTLTIQKDVLVPSVLSNHSFLSTLSHIATPADRASLPTVLEDDIYEISEYLSLLFLQSPRITKQEYGKVDPYICRYSLPDAGTCVDQATAEQEEDVLVEDVRMISYSGLISSDFVTQLVVDLIRRSRVEGEKGIEGPSTFLQDESSWAAVQVNAHPTEVRGGTNGYTILLQSGTAQEIAVEQVDQDTGDRRAPVDAMDVDQSQQDTTQSKHEKNKEFKYVTCFEFVDSAIH
ncbi:hypothetical protein LTR05_001727 [Lithohypha guttulata]|uniref:Uncharacterized protein n=1 Tax=Lithohypha guttulata TaxID=1690604 RepID=A0AAN7YAK4_9EURO|nr:hypothetical protein LTR05_001727 [Lithohypha guttulata]